MLKVAKLGFDRKMRKYFKMCADNDLNFMPIALESTGGIAPCSLEALKTFSIRVCSGYSDDVSYSQSILFKRISVALQRANAECISRRLSHDTTGFQIENFLEGIIRGRLAAT